MKKAEKKRQGRDKKVVETIQEVESDESEEARGKKQMAGKNKKGPKKPEPESESKDNQVVYDIHYLLTRDSKNDLIRKLSDIRRDQTKFGSTIGYFVAQLVGLGKVAKDYDVDFNKIEDQFKGWIEKVQINPKLLSPILFLSGEKDKDQTFLTNFNQFLKELFQDKRQLVSDAPILQYFAQLIKCVCESKFRRLRVIGIQLMKILVDNCIQFSTRDQSKDYENSISQFLSFNVQTLAQKFSDVCQHVRSRSAAILFSMLDIDFMDKDYILHPLSDILNDKVDIVVSLGLSCIFKLHHAKIDYDLVPFYNKILGKLYDIAQQYPKLIDQVLELLILFKRHSSKIGIKSAQVVDLIGKISKNEERLVRLVPEFYYVCLFEEYRSSSEEDLIEAMRNNQKLIKSEDAIESIVTLFDGHMETKDKVNLFVRIVQYDQQLYGFDHLFQYLETQDVRDRARTGRTRPMTKSQLQNLLILIHATSKSVSTNKWLGEEQKVQKLEEFTRKVYEVNDQIIDKFVPRHEQLTDDYIRLYSVLGEPTEDEGIKNARKIFSFLKEMFMNVRGNTASIRLILATAHKINPKEGVLELLSLVDQKSFCDDLRFDEMNKMNEIYNFVDWTNRFPISVLIEMMPRFFNIKDEPVQILLIEIFSKIHTLKLKQLLSERTQLGIETYLSFRTPYVLFLFTAISRTYLSMNIRKLIFVHLCQLLSTILNNKVNAFKFFQYQLTSDNTRAIYSFLYNIIVKKEDKLKMTNGRVDIDGDIKLEDVDYSKMKINMESILFVRRVIKLISESLKFALETYTSKFILVLLRSPETNQLVKDGLMPLVVQEALPENKKSFVYWKLFRNIVLDDRIKEDVRNSVSDDLLEIYMRGMQDKKNVKHRTTLIKRFLLFFAETLSLSISESKLDHFGILMRMFEAVKKKVESHVIKRLLDSTSQLPDTVAMRQLWEQKEFQDLRECLKIAYKKREQYKQRKEKKQNKRRRESDGSDSNGEEQSKRSESAQNDSEEESKKTKLASQASISESENESGSENGSGSERENSSSYLNRRQRKSRTSVRTRRTTRSNDRQSQSILDQMRQKNKKGAGKRRG